MSEFLTPLQRLALNKLVNSLSMPDFEALIFAFNAPKYQIPSNLAAQGNRAVALLDWVEGPTGCGLEEFLMLLEEIAPRAFQEALGDHIKSRDNIKSTPNISLETSANPAQHTVAEKNEILSTANWKGSVRKQNIAIKKQPSLLKTKHNRRTAVIVSLVVSFITVTLRLQGFFSPLELAAYDLFMRLSLDSIKTDDRITIIGIKDSDLNRWGETELSDWKLLKILENLRKANPSVISLDIFRDEPQEDSERPGKAQSDYTTLTNYLGNPSNNIISTCFSQKVGKGNKPPFKINENSKEIIGFSNIVEDKLKNSTYVRRQLLRMDSNDSACDINQSLSYRTALMYLENFNIESRATPDLGYIQLEVDYIQLGKTPFIPVFSNTGGYSDIDDGGYQILINYRIREFIEVSAFDILHASDESEILKRLENRIVLIGYTSKEENSINEDVHYIPIGKASGVELHAHMIRNILSPLNGEQPLIITFPLGIDLVIISFWCCLGGNLIWILKSNRAFIIIVLITVAIIFIGYLSAFAWWGWWLPFVPSIIGWLISIVSLIGINLYRTQRRKR